MRTVLIVEGNDSVADLFSDLFAHEGWTVATSREGLPAADALGGRAPYDAVLVSSRLDDISGVELIGRIRALAHRRDVPIVMVTGAVEVALVAAALAAGADGVLHKPTDVGILVATVTKYVERLAGKAGPAKPRVRLVTFACPLCRDIGRISTLVAEVESETVSPTAVDLQGKCAHANGFGHLDQLRLQQEWHLIAAAMDAARREER